jgi:hypothetical protein
MRDSDQWTVDPDLDLIDEIGAMGIYAGDDIIYLIVDNDYTVIDYCDYLSSNHSAYRH